MVIPDKNGKIFRLQLTAFNLKFLKTIAILLIFATVGVLIDYTYIKLKHSGQQELEQQLYYQKFLIHQKYQELSKLTVNLNHFEKFGHKLRIISGLQDTQRPAQSAGFGITKEIQNPTPKEIQTVASKIQTNINSRLVSFFQLQAYLQERQTRLVRTPSIAPTKGYMSSPFGLREDPITKRKKMHKGLDYSNVPYTPIYAPADGVVVNTYVNSGYGNFLVIDHGYDIVTRYGHLTKYEVKVGQKVKRGDLIARMGNTGRSTGTHLHYEVLVRDQHVDPALYILDAM